MMKTTKAKGERSSPFFVHRMLRAQMLSIVPAMVVLAIGNIAEAFFVGKQVGAQGLTAIGLSYPPFLFVQSVGVALATGCSIHFSRALAEGRSKECVRLFSGCVWACVGLGLLIAAMGVCFSDWIATALGAPASSNIHQMTAVYTRIILAGAPLSLLNIVGFYFLSADDASRTAGIGLVLGNAVDFLMNAVLVQGLNLGVEGAALATVAGYAVSVAIYIPHIFRGNGLLKLKMEFPKLRKTIRCFLTGFASSCLYFLQFVALIVVNGILMRINTSGVGVAIFDIALNVSCVLLSFAEGTGTALQPITGMLKTERNIKAAKTALRCAIVTMFGITLAFVITSALFSRNLALFFGIRDAYTLSICAKAICITCLSVLPGSILMVICADLVAEGQEWFAVMIYSMRSCLFLILFAWLLYPLGIESIWWFLPLSEGCTLIITAVFLWFSSRHTKQDSSACLSLWISQGVSDLTEALTRCQTFCEKEHYSERTSLSVYCVVEELCALILADNQDAMIQITLFMDENAQVTLCLRNSIQKQNPMLKEVYKLTNRSIDDGDALASVGLLLVRNTAKSWAYRFYYNFNTLVIKL